METFHSSVGAKLLDYNITRGKYGFYALVDADSFEMMAALVLMAKGSETVNDLVICDDLLDIFDDFDCLGDLIFGVDVG